MFGADVTAAIKAHAKKQYPAEACGFVVGDLYMPRRNVAKDPAAGFEMAPGALLEAQRYGSVQALVHSHPDGPDCPSEADMRQQIAHAIPWGIVSTNGEACLEPFWFGDQVERPPLVGRGFRFGVTDCYSLIRDWYLQERGVRLADCPRSWDFWSNGENLYLDNFAAWGFRRIDAASAAPGDVCLAQLRSDVPNHGAVYLGNGLILHHVAAMLPADVSRLSKREPVARYLSFITHWMRHD